MVHWWEGRRVRYNLCLFCVGFVAWWLVWVAGSAAVKPGVDFEEPIGMVFGPILFAVLANICYTFGTLVDFLQNDGAPSKRLFKIGLYFSVLVTALPGLWALTAWIGTLITGRKLD